MYIHKCISIFTNYLQLSMQKAALAFNIYGVMSLMPLDLFQAYSSSIPIGKNSSC